MKKIAVVGSRDFTDYLLLAEILELFFDKGFEIISGGAEGADSLAENYATRKRLKCTVFKADWDVHGKSAGFIRNQLIVDAADIVVAFWDGVSKGTKDTLDKAHKARKITLIVYFNVG
ncbi:MAG: SLOG family protein [Nitrosopumilus sp.]